MGRPSPRTGRYSRTSLFAAAFATRRGARKLWEFLRAPRVADFGLTGDIGSTVAACTRESRTRRMRHLWGPRRARPRPARTGCTGRFHLAAGPRRQVTDASGRSATTLRPVCIFPLFPTVTPRGQTVQKSSAARRKKNRGPRVFQYARVPIFRSNAADGGFWTVCPASLGPGR